MATENNSIDERNAKLELYVKLVCLASGSFDGEDLSLQLEESNDLDVGLLNRFISWISFVDVNISKYYIPYHSQIIPQIIDLALNNDLFVEQTTTEFKASKYFLKQFWRLTSQRDLCRISPKSLLSLALIYGKYSGMVCCRFKDAVDCLYDVKLSDNAVEFFTKMFIKYPAPPIFLYNFNNLTVSEIDCLMFMASGKNIRHFDKLPLPISRKESFLINQFSIKIDLKDQVLKKIIVYAKLQIGLTNSNLFFQNFITACNSSSMAIDDFIVNINFWKSVLKFFDVNVHLIEFQQFFLFMDYFIYLAQYSPDTYNLKGRTYKSVVRDLNDWHYRNDFSEMEVDMNTEWLSKGVEAKYYNNNTIRIREITSANELLEESNAMNHCVFSYLDKCTSGSSSIWQMQKKKNEGYRSIVTFEVQNGKVVQAYGNANRSLDEDELEVLCNWATDVDF